MRRAAMLIASVGTLVLAITLAWALSDRDELKADLTSVTERLDDTYDKLRASTIAERAAREEAADLAARAKRFRKHARAASDRASSARLSLRRRAALEEVLAPGQEVFQARLLRGTGDDLLVVDWNDEKGARSGVYVWRVGGGSAELVYTVEPRPSFDSAAEGYVLVGPPGAQVEDRYEGWIQWVEVAVWGDATGDGRPDLALQERDSGSGGCGKIRFLENLGGALRQTYERQDCNQGIAIRKGHLVLGTAMHPRGCDQIHGCGRKGTWMRWTGTTWAVVKVTRDLY